MATKYLSKLAQRLIPRRRKQAGDRPCAPQQRSLAGCVLAVALGAVSAAAPVSAQPMAPFDGDKQSFYDASTFASTPGLPGTLLRYQPFRNKWGIVQPGVYRVLYRSTFVYGGQFEPIIASGLVRLPTHPVGQEDGLETLAFTHGSVGVATKCGPSRYGPKWEDWMLSDEVKTVAADYAGLGVDTGLRSTDALYSAQASDGSTFFPFDQTTHPWLSMEAEGRTTIDLVRASQTLEQVLAERDGREPPTLSNLVGVIGSSQGGHAALATGELMGTPYAGNLVLAAVVAGAPGAELASPTNFDPRGQNAIFALGLVSASVRPPGNFPVTELYPSEIMTAQGQLEYEDIFENTCPGSSASAEDFWTTVDSVGMENPLNGSLEELIMDPGFQEFALANNPGNRPIHAPVMVGQVDNDPLVTPTKTSLMVLRYIGTQPDIDLYYCQYPAVVGATGTDELSVSLAILNHVSTLSKLSEPYSCLRPTEGTQHTLSAPAFLRAAGIHIGD